MTHHVYHTTGVILSSRQSGESNRFYRIFTEELGMIGATAQSIRDEKSKLRYVLQDYSVVTLDLVLGKEVWRIVSAGASTPLDSIKSDPASLKNFVKYCEFLLRLIHGESRDPELFQEIITVANFLDKYKLKGELIQSFEILSMLRVLVHLGYVDPFQYKAFTIPQLYSEEMLCDFEKVRPVALQVITNSLNESHL